MAIAPRRKNILRQHWHAFLIRAAPTATCFQSCSETDLAWGSDAAVRASVHGA